MLRDGHPPAIRQAKTPADYQEFACVCRLYVEWCRERYKDIPWLMEEVFGYQALEEELLALAQKYGPPNGRTLLAVLNGEVVGAGAWRQTSPTTCEMKRVFVMDKAKGRGLGRQLVDALIASARSHGFRLMQLDTGDRFTEAIALYSRMGFRRIPPYATYPDKLMPFMVFMEKPI
jgi:GNAT superfamily N-acetyltransferase